MVKAQFDGGGNISVLEAENGDEFAQAMGFLNGPNTTPKAAPKPVTPKKTKGRTKASKGKSPMSKAWDEARARSIKEGISIADARSAIAKEKAKTAKKPR